MRKQPGRRSALLWGLVAALLALPVSAVVLGDLREHWHIWKLRHGDAAQRRTSARELGRSGTFVSISPLTRTARKDQDRWVRRAAVVSLIELSCTRGR